ncbi:adenylate/guanylate cyclase domain-containing protein [Salinimicrobium flavum]|uniref:Adenylate/guanylate cyclase domain-containing protein n=1 Tax=Salinimicrobium flavum TaxID=1737065 RepID=A0ABW5IXG5_9FLAO
MIPYRYFLLFLLALTFCQKGIGQETSVADSLKSIYYSDPQRQNDLELLREILGEVEDPDSTIKYADLLIERSLDAGDEKSAMYGRYKRGASRGIKGNWDAALEDLFKALKFAEKINSERDQGDINIEIGNIYSESKNSEIAMVYYRRGLEYLRKHKDTFQLGKALYNVGDDLLENGEIDSALVYLIEARDIFRRYDKRFHEAYSLGNLGIIYAIKGDKVRAEENLSEAIKVLEEEKDYRGRTAFLSSLAEIYLDMGNISSALSYANASLEAAETYGLKNEMAQAHYQLSEIYDTAGNTEESYGHFKKYVVFRDSIRNVETVEEMANLRTNFEVARKQTEVDLLNEQKRNQRTVVIATVIALFLLVLLAIGLYRRNRYIGRTRKIIEKEKNRSELLLLNILPQETAMELKENGKVRAKRFESVSVLFTDFKNFTHFAENLSPEELVESVDFYFSQFDVIVEKYGLEKIKTVGDAYMCAGGVPFPTEDHAIKIVEAACEMVEFVNQSKTLDSEKETRFDIRIGINTGPVVAGVVGTKKFSYDIWGDAVNIAARMESTSETGKINVSENTYQLVKDHFKCDYRGEIQVKNKGMMKMYFVTRC